MLPRISSSDQNLNKQEVLRPTGLHSRRMGEVVTSLCFDKQVHKVDSDCNKYMILPWDCVLNAAFQFSTGSIAILVLGFCSNSVNLSRSAE